MNRKRYLLSLLLTLSVVFALSGTAQQKADVTAVDPVCGMTVKKAEATATFDYKGTTYYFCNAGCKEAFVKDPDKYLQKKDEAATAKPGTCPRSGMQMPMAGMHRGQAAGTCPMMQMRGQHGPMAASGAGMACPLQSKDVEIKTENLPDGVAVKITSKNAETAKKIQEHLEKMKGMGMGCCCGPGKAQGNK
jgi:YHS domain-containing protein